MDVRGFEFAGFDVQGASVMKSEISLFRSSDFGGMTLFALLLTVTFLALGGLAIDTSQAWRVRTILQVTADAAAHGAAVRMSEPKLGETPTDAALTVVRRSLSVSHLTNTLVRQDVEFGHVNPTTNEFQLSLINPTAVRVTLRRSGQNSNPEPTFLLRHFGVATWELHGRATARIYRAADGDCADPLLSVQGRVQVDDPFLYVGICVSANAGVTYGLEQHVMSSETAALVDAFLASAIDLVSVDSQETSLPDIEDVTNEEPHEWVRTDKSALINALIATATEETTVTLFDAETTTPGETYHVTCTDNGVLYVPPGSVLGNVVLLSECPIKFAADVTIEASVILGNLKVLATSNPSISVTRDSSSPYSENCYPDGGLMLLIYADLDTRLAVPALAEPNSPFGAFLNEVAEETGSTLGWALDTAGTALSNITNELVDIINETTTAAGLDKVCIGAKVMLTSDSITLATAD